MLNPQILLGDRIQDTSIKVFKRIQQDFLNRINGGNNFNNKISRFDSYTLSILFSPLLYSLDLLPIQSSYESSKSDLVKITLANLRTVSKSDGSFAFSTPSTKNSSLFTSSLCILNLLKIYQDNSYDCYHELRSGLEFLVEKVALVRPKLNHIRADQGLAAYTLLQASIVLNDKKYTGAGSAYFSPILTSSRTVRISNSSFLPNSIDEGLIIRILLDLYELSGKEGFLSQAQNLSRASILKQKRILDSFENGGLGKFFGKSVNLTVLSLSCYNLLRLYQITKEGDLLDLSGYIIRFISDIINSSLEKNILFPSWIKTHNYEISQESCPLGARFYLDATILAKEYFPVSVTQAQVKKVVPLLRVRA